MNVRAYAPVTTAQIEALGSKQPTTVTAPVFVVCAEVAAAVDLPWDQGLSDEDLEVAEHVAALFAAHEAMALGQYAVVALHLAAETLIVPPDFAELPDNGTQQAVRKLSTPVTFDMVASWYGIEDGEDGLELVWYAPEEATTLTESVGANDA